MTSRTDRSPVISDIDPYDGLPVNAVRTQPKELYRLDMLASHRTYRTRDGEIVPGVTTVLNMLNKPALLPWAWNLGRQGIKLEAARQHAADIGTIAHALCEAHLRGMELDRSNLPGDQVDRAETAFLHFLEFWDREGLTLESTELAMVSDRWRVGGTLDILAHRADGKRVVVDLKTSARIYDEYLIQAATYAALYTESSGADVEDVWVVRIAKDDAADVEARRVTQRPERFAAFVALLEARRALQAAGIKL